MSDPSTPPGKESLVAAALHGAACLTATARQLQGEAVVIPDSCKEMGIDLGDSSDGVASLTLVVVAVTETETSS